ncbi:response regulator [Petrachloros mirabilis]
MASTIFVIDSSPAVRRMVEQISTPEGYDVVGFQDGPAALDAARKVSPDLIITDYHLHNMTFSGFCKEVSKLDNLADTYIVALTGATDKLDESHLKSLGVKALLKKPFQSETLLDLLKNLDHVAATAKSRKKKTRSWPPTSSATDSEDDEVINEMTGEGQDGEDLKITIPYPVQTPPPVKKEPTMTPTGQPATAKSASAEPEEAMKGLFGQLLQSMTEKTEKKITELLPTMVTKDLTSLVAQAVENEVQQQVGAGFSQERLVQAIEPVLTNALPKILKNELSMLEPIIRSSVHEIANPLIKEYVRQLVDEQAEKVKASLTDVLEERLASAQRQVEENVNHEATARIEKLVEAAVRTTAEEQIQQAVQQLIPSIAETQIKAEIARLSEAA